MTGATIATIKVGLIAAYEAIVLPSGLGSPTAIGQQSDGALSVPVVEIYSNPSQGYSQSDEDGYITSRLFVTRLYVILLENDTPSVEITGLELADSCVDTVTDYFYFTDDRLGAATGVIDATIIADSGGVRLTARSNDNYAGVAFQHLVSYIRER